MSPASFVLKYLNASPQPVNPLYSTGQVTLVPLVTSLRFRLILISAASLPDEREARPSAARSPPRSPHTLPSHDPPPPRTFP